MFDHLADKEQLTALATALENSQVPRWAIDGLFAELDKEIRTHDHIAFERVSNDPAESTYAFDIILTERIGPETNWMKRPFCRDITHEMYNDGAVAVLTTIFQKLGVKGIQFGDGGTWPEREALYAGYYAHALAKQGYSLQFSMTGRVVIMNARAIKDTKTNNTTTPDIISKNIYVGTTAFLALSKLAQHLAAEAMKDNPISLEEAVGMEVEKFTEEGMDFSAHDITEAVRKNVDTEYAIDGLDTFMDANGKERTNIVHNDVKDVVTNMYHNQEIQGYRREATPKYWLFKPVTPKLDPAPAQQAASAQTPAAQHSGCCNPNQPVPQ